MAGAGKGPKLKISPFDVFGERLDLGKRWEKWIERFTRELKYNGTDPLEKPDMAQMALLIYAGADVEDIHDSLAEPVKPEGITDLAWTSYAKALHKLNAYFVPQKSNDFAIFEMMNIKPESKECTQNYAARLRNAASKCDFSNWSADKMIKCLVITNLADEELRLSCLQKDYTLDQVLNKAQKKEDAQVMSKKIDKDEVHKIGEKQRYKGQHKDKRQDSRKRWEGGPKSSGSAATRQRIKTDDTMCRNCGGDKHANFKEECPAIGKMCNYCKKPGHFFRVCLAKMINQISEMKHDDTDTEMSDNEGEIVDKIEERMHDEVNVIRENKIPLLNITTAGHEFVWQPDTGASRDIWSQKHVEQYERETGTRVRLEPSRVKLFAYGQDQPLELKGQFEAKLQAGLKTVKTQIIVTNDNSKYPLLSEGTARELGVVSYDRRFMVKMIEEDNDAREKKMKEQIKLEKVIKKSRIEVQQIIRKYPNVFSGEIGCAPREVKIMVDDSQQPVAQRGRRIPYNLEEKSEEKLAELLEADVIERVPDDAPRTWVSPPVVAPKPGTDNIRFCVDMRRANETILRPNAQLPTTDDVIDKLRGATVFSRLDLKESYHQFQLDEASRHITTFHGPDALYRYKRLNYGTKSAQDILQNEMTRMLAGIPNQMNVSDDILIGGTTDAEHDAALSGVLDTLDRNNITVNPTKCLFDVGELAFLGLIFGEDGVKPDKGKIEALSKADKPGSKEEVRSFLGMAGFSQRFIPKYAQMTAPLREAMTAKRWSWGPTQEAAFEEARNALTDDTVLRPYQIGMQTQLTVDAGPTGLGVVLTQKQNGSWVPVTYKSRSLKDPETRYSQTEREALAIRWGVMKLRKYLLGAPRFNIVTDHRPLCTMFNKHKQDLPPRIERFVMDVQGYDYEVTYQPGKSNIADYLSRHALSRTGSSKAAELEDHVKRVVGNSFAGAPNEFDAVTMQVVQEAYAECEEMKQLMQALADGSYTDKALVAYQSREIKEALYVSEGVVYRGSRVVIPVSLRKKIVTLSHKGHQGLSKTKRLIREFCWFPGVDRMVEESLRGCIPCMAVNKENTAPPIRPHEFPKGPWQVLEMDFQGPYPTGEYLFVLIDRFSKWAEVIVFRRLPDAKTLKKSMSVIFDDKGVPYTCQSDNGPPFQADELKQFAKKEGFVLKHITPEWPRANGEVERFNRTLKATIQKGAIENESIKKSVQTFIRAYRATPHSTTGVSPYEAMFGRKMKGDLPSVPMESNMINRDKIKDFHRKMQARPGKPHQLVKGDSVLVKQSKRNKLTPKYDTTPARVVNVKGSMVTVESGGKDVTRDGSKFKKIPDIRVDINTEDNSSGEEESVCREDDIEEGDGDRPSQSHTATGVAESQQRTDNDSIAKSRTRRSTAGVPPARLGIGPE